MATNALPGRAGPAVRLAQWWRRRRVVVVDRSMRPTLEPGDRLYVDPAAADPRRLHVGDLVVFPDPRAPERRLIKRVARLPEIADPGHPEAGEPFQVPHGHAWVVADDPDAGSDSRQFGPVALDRIEGVAWYRYAPAHRRGTLAPPPAR